MLRESFLEMSPETMSKKLRRYIESMMKEMDSRNYEKVNSIWSKVERKSKGLPYTREISELCSSSCNDLRDHHEINLRYLLVISLKKENYELARRIKSMLDTSYRNCETL